MLRQLLGSVQVRHLHSFFLRGSRTVKRVSWDFRNAHIDVETIEGAIK